MRRIASARLAGTTGLCILIDKPLSREQILFHADVGQQEGWGHLHECLSVAESLRQRGLEPSFVLPSLQEAQQKVAQQGYTSQALPNASWRSDAPFEPGSDLIQLLKGNFVVTNLVSVSNEYAKGVTEIASGWAVITERKDQELAPLNFNICQAPEYMPLNVVYQDGRPHAISETLRTLLISFGGSDPRNAGGLILELLRQGFETGALARDLQITMVMGPLFEYASLMNAVKDKYPIPFDVVGPLSPIEFASLASSSDVGITMGGGVMYEFCALGLPSIVVPVREKMRDNARVLERKDAVIVLQMSQCLSAQDLADAINRLRESGLRRALSSSSQAAVDGRGAERITARLIDQWNLRLL